MKVNEALVFAGEAYIHMGTLRKKLKEVGDDILKHYEEGCRKNFQRQLDNGEAIDIRLSNRLLKQNIKDFGNMWKGMLKFLKETEYNVKEDARANGVEQ